MKPQSRKVRNCPACRGRGWKYRRRRRAVVVGTLNRGLVEAVRVTCKDCDGGKRAR